MGRSGQGDEVPFFLGRSCYGGRYGRGRSDSIGDEVTDFWGPKWQGAEVTLNQRCLPNIQLLTAHFDNNRYKERVGTGNLAVNSICVSDKYYLNLMYGSGSYMVPPNFLVFHVLNDSKKFFFCRKFGL